MNCAAFSGLAAWLALPVLALAGTPPINWVAPPEFDPRASGLGLKQLPGVTHEIIYAPAPSRAAIEAGGDGRYESALHGTYNHHTRAVRVGDKVLVYWTNHSHDENGPGQRIVARWGVIDPTSTRIDWVNRRCAPWNLCLQRFRSIGGCRWRPPDSTVATCGVISW